MKSNLVIAALPAIALLLACQARGPGGAPSDAAKFTYRPDRVPVGTVFHYVKSNRDGTHAIRVSAYVAALDRIEVVKLEPGEHETGFVIAHLDWTTFSADSLRSWSLDTDGARRLQAAAWLTATGAFVAVVGGQTDTVTVGQYPAHVYDFDLLSLAQLFPHLRDPEGEFTIGLLNPTVAIAGKAIRYAGTATIRFIGEAPCHDRICRSYEIGGPVFRDARGSVWVTRDEGIVENIEAPIPANPGWHDFKLTLVRREPMDAAAWAAWVRAPLVVR